MSQRHCKVLHGLGIAVRTVIGTDTGLGQVQGLDLRSYIAYGQFRAEATALAAQVFTVTDMDG